MSAKLQPPLSALQQLALCLRALPLRHVACRDYSCVTGQPSLDILISGQNLPPDACSCTGAGECAVVARGSFLAGSTAAVTTISGQLAPVAFASLAGIPASELQCFNTSLAHASDNYKVGPMPYPLVVQQLVCQAVRQCLWQ